MCVIKTFPYGRFLSALLQAVLLLTLFGCATQATTNDDALLNNSAHRNTGLSKIYIDYIASASDAISMEKRKLLKQALSQQLQQKDLLLEHKTARALLLRVVMISYENSLLEVQAELHDKNTVLARSQIKRKIPLMAVPPAAIDTAWASEIEPIAAELLDQLIKTLYEQSGYTGRIRPNYNSYHGGWYGGGGWGHQRRREKSSAVIFNPPRPIPVHPVPPVVIQSIPQSGGGSSHKNVYTAPESIYIPPSSHPHDEQDQVIIDTHIPVPIPIHTTPSSADDSSSAGEEEGVLHDNRYIVPESDYTPPSSHTHTVYEGFGGSSSDSGNGSSSSGSSYTPPQTHNNDHSSSDSSSAPVSVYTPPASSNQEHHSAPPSPPPAPASPPPSPPSAASSAPSSVGSAAPGSHRKHHQE